MGQPESERAGSHDLPVREDQRGAGPFADSGGRRTGVDDRPQHLPRPYARNNAVDNDKQSGFAERTGEPQSERYAGLRPDCRSDELPRIIHLRGGDARELAGEPGAQLRPAAGRRV